MAYVSTPGLHGEFAQPDAAEPAALGFQEELAQLNEAEPAALQGGSQEPTVEGTMSPPAQPSPVAAELIKPTMNNKSMMRPPRPLDCLPMIGSHAALSRSDGILFR